MHPRTGALFLLIFALSGCMWLEPGFHFDVIAVNLTRETIHDAHIFDSTGTYDYGPGVLVPFAPKSHEISQPSPPNDLFTVRWNDPRGRAREQVVDLRSRVKRGFSGQLVFYYQPSETFTVEVVPAPGNYHEEFLRLKERYLGSAQADVTALAR